MTEQNPVGNRAKSSKSYKKVGSLDSSKIDGSGEDFYNEVKAAVKEQQKEMMKFNEVDENQLRLVVQL